MEKTPLITYEQHYLFAFTRILQLFHFVGDMYFYPYTLSFLFAGANEFSFFLMAKQGYLIIFQQQKLSGCFP